MGPCSCTTCINTGTTSVKNACTATSANFESWGNTSPAARSLWCARKKAGGLAKKIDRQGSNTSTISTIAETNNGNRSNGDKKNELQNKQKSYHSRG